MSSRLDLHQQYRRKNGTLVPGATTVIGDNIGWNGKSLISWAAFEARRGRDHNEIRERAARIGTMAHALIEAELTGEKKSFDNAEYASAEQQAAMTAYSAFRKFVQDGHELVVEHCEIQLASEKYAFGGTIDFVGKMNGEPVIIDFKTSSKIHPEHRIQISAYQELWREFSGKQYQPYLLHLDKKDGSYSLKLVTTAAAGWRAFQHALALSELREGV